MKQNIYLTHNGIKTFNQCKMQFKNRYIDNLPLKKHYNKHFSFDLSIHKTLAEFNKSSFSKDNELGFLLHHLNKHWISKGYSSKLEELEFKNKAIEVLTNYNTNPIDIGKETIVIDSLLHKSLADDLILNGRVDKLHLTDSNLYEVIDYKTGVSLSPKDSLSFNMQIATLTLLIYENLHIQLNLFSYYYLVPNRKFTISIAKEHLTSAKRDIALIASQIKKEKIYECCKYPCNNVTCDYFNNCFRLTKYYS